MGEIGIILAITFIPTVIIHQLLQFVILRDKDPLQKRKGKKMIIWSITFLVAVFLLKTILYAELNTLCI